MPQIGWFEILIIVSIAIIVVGPKDFPIMLKKVGSWIGSAKRYVSDIQNQVTNVTEEKFDNIDEKSKTDINQIDISFPRIVSIASSKDDDPLPINKLLASIRFSIKNSIL